MCSARVLVGIEVGELIWLCIQMTPEVKWVHTFLGEVEEMVGRGF